MKGLAPNLTWRKATKCTIKALELSGLDMSAFAAQLTENSVNHAIKLLFTSLYRARYHKQTQNNKSCEKYLFSSSTN